MAAIARSRLLQLALAAALVTTIVGSAALARADDPEAARAAYDRGAAAFQAKRYAEAAADLARADALAPNPVALASALKAAELADDPILAMTLADRAELRPGVGEAALANARRVREKMGARVGKLSIRCAAVRGCSVTVDAEPFPTEQQRWVKAGAHAVEITAGGSPARYTVTVEGGKTADFVEPSHDGAASGPKPRPGEAGPNAPEPSGGEPVAPPPGPPKAEPPKAEPPKAEPPKAEPPAPRGISPAWFFVGLGATAVAGGVLVWSGVDTLAKHSDFVGFVTSDPSAGQAAQTRTNVLVGVTAAAGVATAALGIFAVRWSAAPARPAPSAWLRSLTVAPSPAGVTALGRF
jgi:hypothetical protein